MPYATMARHRSLLTLRDWDALPEDDEFHTDVSEGVLTLSKHCPRSTIPDTPGHGRNI